MIRPARLEDLDDLVRIENTTFGTDRISRRNLSYLLAKAHAATLVEHMERGGFPVILISSYRLYQEKFPHWIVVTGYDENYFYVHDPYVDAEAGKTLTDCVNMPILKADFQRMARYGKTGQKAVLILRKPKPSLRRH
jgi:hypothetical protein